MQINLKAFSVDNRRSAFIIFLLGDPHLLESGERSKDGSSDPDRVFSLRRSDDLDLDGGGSKSSDLLLHTVSNTGVHGGASRHDSVSIEIFTDTTSFHSKEGRLEESLRAAETLISNGNDLTIRKFIGLFKGGGGSSS